MSKEDRLKAAEEYLKSSRVGVVSLKKDYPELYDNIIKAMQSYHEAQLKKMIPNDEKLKAEYNKGWHDGARDEANRTTRP